MNRFYFGSCQNNVLYTMYVCWCVVYVCSASGNDFLLSIDVRPIFLDMSASRACYNNNKNIIIIIITISRTGFDLHARDYIVYFVIVLVFSHYFGYFGILFDIVDS